MDLYLILFTIAFFITMLVTPFIAWLAFFVGAVDRPNGRKIHDTFMPRLGGLAIFLGFFTAMLVLVTKKPIFTGLLVGGTIVLILGMIDDIRGVSPRVKLLWQTMAALVVVYFCFDMDTLSNFLHGLFRLGILAVPLTVFWIVAVTNAVNLIDGLDGLASGVSAIALLTFAFIAYRGGQESAALVSVILVGAILGFIRYNFFPAKIFLGDSGSLFLGFMVAVLSAYGIVQGTTLYAFIIPIIVLGVPIVDTCYAIVRRFYEKQPIFQPDKKHIHHRLLKRGYTQIQAVLLIYAISVCLSISALLIMYGVSSF